MRKWCVSSSLKLMEMGKWSLFLPHHRIVLCCGYNQPWPQSRFYSSVAPSGKHCNWLVGATISQVHSQHECDAFLFMLQYAWLYEVAWHYDITATKIKCTVASLLLDSLLCALKRQVSMINKWLMPVTQLGFSRLSSLVQ